MRTLLLLALAVPLAAQDIKLDIFGGQSALSLAVPESNGVAGAQAYMAVFHSTLWSDLEESGAAQLRSRSLYPKTRPAQPSDVRPNEWSRPPVSAAYLAFGYGAIQADQFVFRGYLVDFSPNPPLIAGIYRGAPTETGARKAAHEFAADIIRKLGGEPILGTKIFFRSQRAGHAEIWVMDPDGGNPRQLTRNHQIVATLGVSPDGAAFAFTAWTPFPKVEVWSSDPPRALRFANPAADLVITPSFTPDGKLIYATRRNNRSAIVIAGRDGSSPRQLTEGSIEAEPAVNPKSGTVAFISDRSGLPQLYTMNLDGGDINRVSNGEGEVANPAWHPKGEILAFAWTKGLAPGNWNIYIMAAARPDSPVLLTRDARRNEHPSWSPDGTHIVFSSTRSGTSQIWTMLADGTRLRQLTTEGVNDMPVWSK